MQCSFYILKFRKYIDSSQFVQGHLKKAFQLFIPKSVGVQTAEDDTDDLEAIDTVIGVSLYSGTKEKRINNADSFRL